jgi:hypothetical protein
VKYYLQFDVGIVFLHSLKTERWLRGRKHQFAKLAYGKLYRGFESRPLR